MNQSNHTKRASFSLAALLSTLVMASVVVFPPSAAAQAFSAEGETVRSIDVQFAGAAGISKERILANMQTKVGRPFSQAVVEQDIRSLYETGSVSNLRIFSEPVEGGVRVIVVVQPRTMIRSIEIVGADKISARRIRKELGIEPDKALNEAELESARQKILGLYAEKDYSDVEVSYQVKAAEGGSSDVVFNIVEGGKTKIVSIGFEGNTVLTTKELKKVVKTKKSNLLSVFTKDGRLDEEKLDADIQAVREAYQAKGYVDADVVNVRRDPVKDNLGLVFEISEGPQYRVARVSTSGFTVITNEEASTLLGVKSGDLFAPKSIEAGIKAIESAYGARGYVDLALGREVTPGGAGVLNLGIDANEGGPSYVEQINISGNKKTRDKVIRRELSLAPGDLYNSLLVDNSRKRVEGLALFEKVEAYPGDTGVDGKKNLNIEVEEKRTGNLSFGAGFSSIDNLIGFVELSQGNFDISNWRTFTGAGQKLRVRGVYGVERRDGQISFVEPWFLDQQLALGVDLYYRDAQYYSNVFEQRNVGAAISLRKPLGEFSSLKLEYRIEDIAMDKLEDDATEEFVRSAAQDGLQGSLTLTYTFDNRDSTMLSRRGTRFDVGGFLMGGFLGGDQDIFGLNAEFSQYFSLPGDTILLVNAEVSTIDTMGGSSFIPVYNRLYLGGANSLRGFDFRDVGPKDDLGEAIGGNTLARLTLEYTFPILPKVRGAVFYDMGVVSDDSFDFGGDLNSDVGAGLRLDLPIGPIRVDLGFPLQTDDFNDEGVRFNFNVGWQF